MSEAEKLSTILRAWLDAQDAIPDDGRYLPDDGICPGCNRLKRNHPGVERVLAIRGLKRLNPITQAVTLRAGIPYCVCQRKRASSRKAA